ncbi:H2AX protein, partial [Acromyrmex heyeri]
RSEIITSGKVERKAKSRFNRTGLQFPVNPSEERTALNWCTDLPGVMQTRILRHLQLAIRNEELNKLLTDVIAQGVLPNIQTVLLSKKKA